jgi:TPR repeat protein
VAQNSETTRIRVAPGAVAGGPEVKGLAAVRQAVGAEYDILGELGRAAPATVVYVARQVRGGALVALRLRPGEGAAGAGEMWLDVLRQLDSTTPGPTDTCVTCGQTVGGWDRFCARCGADLASAGSGASDAESADRLLRAVKEAAGTRYDVLGQMDRAEGGGIVYFAREVTSGNLVALRLRKDATTPGVAPQFSLSRTTVLKSVAESLAVVYGAPPTPPSSPSSPASAPSPPSPPSPPSSRAAPPVATPAGAAPDPMFLRRYGLLLAALAGIVVLIMVVSSLPPRTAVSTTQADTSAGSTALPRPEPAQVMVGGALPPGTTISVDGQVVTGPTLSVPPGKHTFRAVARGYFAATQLLELAAGQQVTWTPSIVPRPEVPTRPPPPGPAAGEAVAHAPSPPVAAPQPAPVQQANASAASSGADSTLANLPTTTSSATCASLFSTLEWDRALPACQGEARDGNVASQRTLGTLYDRGLGTEVNPKQAAVWYRRAADAGDRAALYRLGALERDGRGVRRDDKGAVDLFRQSAGHGDPDAQSAMGTAYERGVGVKRDYAQAVDWYRKAADQGRPGAAYRLGELYDQGKGVPQSLPDAIIWWKKAAAGGEPAAQQELRRHQLAQ